MHNTTIYENKQNTNILCPLSPQEHYNAAIKYQKSKIKLPIVKFSQKFVFIDSVSYIYTLSFRECSLFFFFNIQKFCGGMLFIGSCTQIFMTRYLFLQIASNK